MIRGVCKFATIIIKLGRFLADLRLERVFYQGPAM